MAKCRVTVILLFFKNFVQRAHDHIPNMLSHITLSLKGTNTGYGMMSSNSTITTILFRNFIPKNRHGQEICLQPPYKSAPCPECAESLFTWALRKYRTHDSTVHKFH